MSESGSSQKWGKEWGWTRWGPPLRSSSWVVLSLFMSISNKNIFQTNTCHYYHIWAPCLHTIQPWTIQWRQNNGITQAGGWGRNSKHFNNNNIISLMPQWSHISTCYTVDSCGLCPQHWHLFYEMQFVIIICMYNRYMSLRVLHSRRLDGSVSECQNVGGSVTSPVFIAIPRVSGRAVLSSGINMNTAH